MINTTEILDFSELIKTYRKSKGMKQKEFGELIGKKQVTISNYENGVHYPNVLEEIQLIASVINQPVSVVVNSILYSQSGIIEQHKVPIILDKTTLHNGYQFIFEDKEVTNEEFEKMLELLRFERFKRNQ